MLLLLAGVALLVAGSLVAGYPGLVSLGLSGGLATTVRAVGVAAYVLAPVLAVAALVRRIAVVSDGGAGPARRPRRLSRSRRDNRTR